MMAYGPSQMLDVPRPRRLKRWTKAEYNALVEKGALAGQRVYLFRGDLIEMAPQQHPHAITMMNLTPLLVHTFEGLKVRIQLPFDAPGDTTPEPDALVCTQEQGVRRPHPNTGLLVIEVADSAIDEDRDRALEYAAAGVPEYWIIDLKGGWTEVYRDPIPDKSTELGFRYGTFKLVDVEVPITPLAAPSAAVVVATLLPKPD